MKLLYIANVSDLYGASRSLVRLAGRFAREGHQVRAILPAEGPLRERLEDAGVEVIIHGSLPVLTRRELGTAAGRLRLLLRTPASVVRLAAHIRRFRPDIVHTNSAVVFTGALAARLCGRAHVWHMREFLADISPLWHVYQWVMYLLSSRIVCNSAAVAGQFHPSLRNRRVQVIYNGVPACDPAPPPAARLEAFKREHGITGSPVVGVVGRLNLEQKGQDVFVAAAAALAHRFPQAAFVVAGSPFPGNEEHGRRLRRLVAGLGLGDRVVFTGDVRDLACLHAALDVCVLPARKPEGLGNVLLEAMALGRPVIGSAVGGIPEVIEDGVTGLLVAPNDSGGLAGALERLLADTGLRVRMGNAGRRRFEERFELEACSAEVERLYRAVAGDRRAARVLGMRVDRTSYQEAARKALDWALAGESRYLCAASVNNVMEAHDSADFMRVMNEADLVTPDGMPLVWGMRLLGASGATRVYGPDLTPVVLGEAERAGVPVGFYGATAPVLARLEARLRRRFPKLNAPYWYAPPFRPLSPSEDEEVVRQLRRAGVRILFVGLGTPKQERWMAAHRGRVPAVMLGVGAAFDFLAGVKPQAPGWMQNHGLEWMFRLACEPRRLWRRYLKHNPRFAALFAAQWLEQRFTG